MTEREAFEAWAKKAGWPHHFTSCNTKDPNAYSQESWEVWQAARAQPAQAVPRLTDEEKAEFVDQICEYGTDFVAPLFAAVESIEAALLAKIGGKT